MLFNAKFPTDRKSTRLNSSHRCISYAVFCLKKKKNGILVRRPGLCVALLAELCSAPRSRGTSGGTASCVDVVQRDSGAWAVFFFFNDTATTEIYTLSLHDALPI